MERITIGEVIEKFIDPKCNRQHSRETTFDLCFNYFHENRERLAEDMEKSCCVLWLYLASWGMLRGSTLLLQKNPAYLMELVEFIASEKCDKIFFVDVDNYEDGGIEEIMKIYGRIEELLRCEKDDNDKERTPTATLITKVMLGIFGCVPAYDKYFCDAFKEIKPRTGFSSYRVDPKTLTAISEFYKENRDEINTLADTTNTIDIFYTAKDLRTPLKYTKAKIIDMYGYGFGVRLPK